MKLVRVGVIAAAILAVATVVWAQKPDFSGVTESTQVWTVEGSTLTVETTDARGTQKRVYKKSL